MTEDGPFSTAALPTNRSGRLTDAQAAAWREFARQRRNGIRRGCYPAIGIGLLLLLANGPAANATRRQAIGIASLAVAAVILLVAGRGPLASDLRHGDVARVEGAIAKHRQYASGSAATTRFYFDIAGDRLRVGRGAYEAAPDAGFVRAFYLPRSRRLVNLERLAAPVPAGPGAVQQVVDAALHAIRSRDPISLAEARARGAALMDAVTGRAAGPRPRGPDAVLRPESLWGTWTNPLMTVTFTRDGAAALRLVNGQEHAGRWSVAGDGRLLIEAAAEVAPADAWMEGDELRFDFDGNTIALKKTAHA